MRPIEREPELANDVLAKLDNQVAQIPNEPKRNIHRRKRSISTHGLSEVRRVRGNRNGARPSY